MSKVVRREHLFGIAPCLAAILAGRRKIFKLYLNDKLEEEEPRRKELVQLVAEANERNIKLVYKSRPILDRLCGGRPHQNVVMETGKLNLTPITRESYTVPNHERFLLALDDIQDPMNLGAIIRSATYFGVDKIIVNEKSSCGLTATVSKVSSGAMEWASVYSTRDMHRLLKDLLNYDWNLIGTVTKDYTQSKVHSCHDVQLSKRNVLIIGNEGFGMNPLITSLCTKLVTIPSFNDRLPEGLDSLNVSVATGILLHSLMPKQ
ncbi:rRNA methyltransferase 1, mitochondrial isoform X2 [Hydra vulgaris]|uniref:rRNA methyltransferase 1, mitochondrial n=1 Tax=Hydra vulgaris TaxID=6087 RepID=A0ABM4CQ08_HYDVU